MLSVHGKQRLGIVGEHVLQQGGHCSCAVVDETGQEGLFHNVKEGQVALDGINGLLLHQPAQQMTRLSIYNMILNASRHRIGGSTEQPAQLMRTHHPHSSLAALMETDQRVPCLRLNMHVAKTQQLRKLVQHNDCFWSSSVRPFSQSRCN